VEYIVHYSHYIYKVLVRKVVPIMKYKRRIKKSGIVLSSFGGKNEYGSMCAVFQLIPAIFARCYFEIQKRKRRVGV